jgi:hypothetical protein
MIRPFAVCALGALLALPSGAAAQAICSAPHSSPTLSQSGAIRTLPAGAGWVQVSVYGQNANESFNPNGDRQVFLGNSQFDTRSVYFTGAVGVVEGLELWAQVPLHRLSVDGSGGNSLSRGVGDIRTAIRISPALFGFEWPVAVRAGVKIPGSDFPVDATELPLTEGQLDAEVSVDSGWASEDWPLYFVGWLGHRWRAQHVEGEYEPGNERFAHAAVGGSAGMLHWEVGVDGLWGFAPTQQRVVLPGSARRLIQVLPTLGVDVAGGRLEFTVPLPLSGRNLPSDPGFSVGFRTTWGL